MTPTHALWNDFTQENSRSVSNHGKSAKRRLFSQHVIEQFFNLNQSLMDQFFWCEGKKIRPWMKMG